ncbi:MAG: hypothetical protein FWD55_08240 [Propionibacteriaceae bacterium]|nr:hypothetical protein [Propionibacteriaceae bacterium]
MDCGKLYVDAYTLINAGNSLVRISAEFGEAGNRAKDAASHVGHVELAQAIRAFADNWDDKRASLKTSIDNLGKKVTEMGNGFLEMDEEMARKVGGDNACSPPAPRDPNERGWPSWPENPEDPFVPAQLPKEHYVPDPGIWWPGLPAPPDKP